MVQVPRTETETLPCWHENCFWIRLHPPTPDAFIEETLIPAPCPDGPSRQSRLRSGGHHCCQKECPFCVLLVLAVPFIFESHPPRKAPSATKRAPTSPPKQSTIEHVEKCSKCHLDRLMALIDYVLGDKINKHTEVQVNGKRVWPGLCNRGRAGLVVPCERGICLNPTQSDNLSTKVPCIVYKTSTDH